MSTLICTVLGNRNRSGLAVALVFLLASRVLAVPTVGFTNVPMTAEAFDNQTTVQVNVSLSAPSSQTVAVQYATNPNGSTATAGQHYVPVSGTLVFHPGITQQSFIIQLVPGSVPSGSVKINVQLSNPMNCILGPNNNGFVILWESHTPPTLQLSSSSYAVNESAGHLTVTVTLSQPWWQTITCNYATGGGTAVPGTDYTAVSGQLSFPEWTTSLTFQVPIIDNHIPAPSLSFGVGIQNITVAQTGNPQGAMVTILPDMPLPSVSLSPSPVLIVPGVHTVLTATASPSSDTQYLTYSSANTSIATVSGAANGASATITGVSAGSTTVNVYVGGRWWVDSVTVEVEQVTLTPSPVLLVPSGTQTLHGTTLVSSDEQYLTYVSENTGIATISGSGSSTTVTAVSEGDTVIDCYFNGYWVNSVAVSIFGEAIVTPADPVILPGGSGTLNVTTIPADSAAYLTYTSANTSIATVSGSGAHPVIAGVGSGLTQINIYYNGTLVGTIVVKVLGSEDFTPNPVLLLPAQTQTLTATNDSFSQAQNLTYASAHTAVATVTGSGLSATVTAVAAGTTQINVSYGQTSVGSVPVYVFGGATITPNPVCMIAGNHATVTATTSPSADAQYLTWVSNDTSLATVQGSGATVTVSGIRGGATSIDAFFGSNCVQSVDVFVLNYAIVTPNPLYISNGDVAYLSATTDPPDAANDLTYISQDTTIATVDPLGSNPNVYSVGDGITQIDVYMGQALVATVTVTVYDTSFTPNPVLGLPGDVISVAASISPSSLASSLTYASEDSTIATVSGSGSSVSVTLVAAGETWIDVSVGGVVLDWIYVIVLNTATLTPNPIDVLIGGSGQLSATTDPPDAADYLTYSSGNTSVATVDASGSNPNVQGVAPGSTAITVSFGQDQVASTSVVVSQLTVTPDPVLLIVNGTATLTATSSGSVDLSTVTYSSEDTTVATVSGSGATVTAVGSGDTQIDVYVSGNFVGTVTVCVINTAWALPNPVLLTPNGVQTLSISSDPWDAVQYLTYSSADTTIATVSGAGDSPVVTGVAAGTTQLNVLFAGNTVATVPVYILSSANVTPNPATLFIGGTVPLSSTTNPAAYAPYLSYVPEDDTIASVVPDDNGNAILIGVGPGASNIDVYFGDAVVQTISVNVLDLTVTPNPVLALPNSNVTLTITGSIASQSFSYSSENSSIATVSGSGTSPVVAAQAAGATWIDIQDNNSFVGSVKVYVLGSATVSPSPVFVSSGSVVGLTGATSPADTVDYLTYSSLDTTIATVDASGANPFVTGVSSGITTIDVYFAGTLVQSIAVYVDQVNIAPGTVNLVPADSQTLSATGNSSVVSSLTYSSEDTSVAGVSGSGASATVTAAGLGQTQVDVYYGTSLVQSISVCVVTVLMPDLINVYPGETGTLTGSLAVTTGNNTNDASLTYTSEDTTVATVSGSGANPSITGVGAGGFTLIDVSLNGVIIGFIPVSVLGDGSVDPGQLWLSPNGTATLTATPDSFGQSSQVNYQAADTTVVTVSPGSGGSSTATGSGSGGQTTINVTFGTAGTPVASLPVLVMSVSLPASPILFSVGPQGGFSSTNTTLTVTTAPSSFANSLSYAADDTTVASTSGNGGNTTVTPTGQGETYVDVTYTDPNGLQWYLGSVTVDVVHVSLWPSSVYLPPNTTSAIQATITPVDAASYVSFSTANGNIASVSGTGESATITAGANGGTTVVSAYVGQIQTAAAIQQVTVQALGISSNKSFILSGGQAAVAAGEDATPYQATITATWAGQQPWPAPQAIYFEATSGSLSVDSSTAGSGTSTCSIALNSSGQASVTLTSGPNPGRVVVTAKYAGQVAPIDIDPDDTFFRVCLADENDWWDGKKELTFARVHDLMGQRGGKELKGEHAAALVALFGQSEQLVKVFGGKPGSGVTIEQIKKAQAAFALYQNGIPNDTPQDKKQQALVAISLPTNFDTFKLRLGNASRNVVEGQPEGPWEINAKTAKAADSLKQGQIGDCTLCATVIADLKLDLTRGNQRNLPTFKIKKNGDDYDVEFPFNSKNLSELPRITRISWCSCTSSLDSCVGKETLAWTSMLPPLIGACQTIYGKSFKSTFPSIRIRTASEVVGRGRRIAFAWKPSFSCFARVANGRH